MRSVVSRGVLSLALAAPLLSGCVIAIGADDDSEMGFSGTHSGRYETLLGADVDARAPQITITASSNGCTSEAQFRPDVDRDDGLYRVGFRRIEPDRCKALMQEGARLTWTFAQLGVPDGARVVVRNPIGR